MTLLPPKKRGKQEKSDNKGIDSHILKQGERKSREENSKPGRAKRKA